MLVGPNGSGKSTVLEAAKIASALDPARAVKFFIERRENREARWLLFGEVRSSSITLVTERGDSITVYLQLVQDNVRPMYKNKTGELGPQRPQDGNVSDVEFVDAAVFNP